MLGALYSHLLRNCLSLELSLGYLSLQSLQSHQWLPGLVGQSLDSLVSLHRGPSSHYLSSSYRLLSSLLCVLKICRLNSLSVFCLSSHELLNHCLYLLVAGVVSRLNGIENVLLEQLESVLEVDQNLSISVPLLHYFITILGVGGDLLLEKHFLRIQAGNLILATLNRLLQSLDFSNVHAQVTHFGLSILQLGTQALNFQITILLKALLHSGNLQLVLSSLIAQLLVQVALKRALFLCAFGLEIS